MPDDYRAYGCILHFPLHPLADMHGLVRATINARSRIEALKGFVDCLARASGKGNSSVLVYQCQFLSESQSHIEREVLRNTQGAVYLCSLATCYLNMSCYQPMRYKLPRLARRLAKRTAETPEASL